MGEGWFVGGGLGGDTVSFEIPPVLKEKEDLSVAFVNPGLNICV
jgi:hypothetical protein